MKKGELLVAERKLPYDTLVMALGSTSNDFNTPGVKENCIFPRQPAPGASLPSGNAQPVP